MKFDVRTTMYSKDFTIYISAGMNNINPLEVEEDIEIMKQYLIDKYTAKSKNRNRFSLVDYLKIK